MASRPTARTIRTAAVVTLALGIGVLGARGWADATPPPLHGPAPNFALTTQQNDRLWLTQLRGRAVVLAFGCIACGACPDLVEGLAEVARSPR